MGLVIGLGGRTGLLIFRVQSVRFRGDVAERVAEKDSLNSVNSMNRGWLGLGRATMSKTGAPV